MAKSRTARRRRKKSPIPAPATGEGTRRTGKGLIGWGVAAVLGAVGGWLWWQFNAAETVFLDLAQAGRPALDAVKTRPNLGRGHVPPGQGVAYGDPFPTSGPHDSKWVEPGFYRTPQTPERLVHAVEHGNIVIYYDTPGDAVVETLDSWTGLYGAQWSGIVVAPAPGLGAAVVLTAWRKVLRLDPFDAAVAAAFVDAYRGRGPEKPVR
jgi:hypothetical protein